jgi:hypothetical protein
MSLHFFQQLYVPTGASVAVATCKRTVLHPLPADTFLTGDRFEWGLPCYLQAFQVGGRPRRGVLTIHAIPQVRPLHLPTGASVAVAACHRTLFDPPPETFLTGGLLHKAPLGYLQGIQVG